MNVFEFIKMSVSSGFRPWVARAMSMGSTFAKNLSVLPLELAA